MMASAWNVSGQLRAGVQCSSPRGARHVGLRDVAMRAVVGLAFMVATLGLVIHAGDAQCAEPPREGATGAALEQEESALYDRFMYHISRGDYAEALEVCVRFREAFPDSPHLPDVSYWTGDLLAARGRDERTNYLEAIDAYREALGRFPAHPLAESAAFRVGELYHQLGFTYEAAEAFGQFLERFPAGDQVPEARYLRAINLYGAGRYEDVERELRTYLEDYPDSPHRAELTLRLADTFFHSAKMSAARVLYEEVEQRWPVLLRMSAESLYQMGEIYFRRNQYAEACKQLLYLTNVHGAYEHVLQAYLRIGESLWREGQVEPALLVFDHVVSRYPDSEEAFAGAMYMADIGTRHSISPPALLLETPEFCLHPEDTYQRLLQDHPYHPLAAMVAAKLGSALLDAGDHTRLVSVLEEYAESSELAVRDKVRELMGEALSSIILDARARGDLETVLTTYAKYRDFLDEVMHQELVVAVGDTLYSLGLYGAEATFYEGLLAREQVPALEQELVLSLAECYRRLGSVSGLDRLVEMAAQRFPRSSTFAASLYALAHAYDEAGRQVDGVETYIKALDEYPAHPRAAEGYYRLGKVLGAQGFAADAARAYQQALQAFLLMHPDEEAPGYIIRCYFLAADALYAAGLYEEAVAWYQRSLRLFPNHPAREEALYFLAAGYRHLGQPERASEVLAELSTLKEPPDAALWSKVAKAVEEDPIQEGRIQQILAEARH